MKHIKYFVGNLYLFSGHFCLLDTASLVNPIVSKQCIAILSIFLVPKVSLQPEQSIEVKAGGYMVVLVYTAVTTEPEIQLRATTKGKCLHC